MIAVTFVWVVPAVLVGVLHLVLPDHNVSGQCEGLGFGCTPTPADAVLLLGMLAAPWLLGLGLVVCVVIAAVQALRRE